MEYSEYLLSDVLDISWGDTKTTKAKYVEDGFIAFSASGPDGFLPYFDFEQTGVVLSAIGANCGKTYLAEGQWSCIKNTMRMIAKSDEMSVDYFYYLSQQSDFFPIRGSAQPFISQTDIRELRVSLPNRVVQDAIVGIIKLLDEKIRLDTEMSKTLEAIAQTIFKSWFIDFDPVHAKMRGEKPEGMDDATAALFPGSFEESELGMIPKGWGVKPVGQVLPTVGGATPSTANESYWNGEHCWTTPKDLSRQSGIVTTASARKITSFGLAKISSGLLPPMSVLMSSRAPIGYLSVAVVPTAINQGFIAFPTHETYPPLYLFNWLAKSMDEIKSRSGGGTFSEISKSAFRGISFLVPKNPVLLRFRELTTPMLEMITALAFENQSLIELRDALLPRLISGELQIPDEMLAS